MSAQDNQQSSVTNDSHHDHHHAREIGDIRFAFFLNITFTLIEIIGGLMTNSVAILSDAVHDFGDSISLGMAWFLGGVAQKGSNQRYTYGYRRYSLVGALLNAVILVGGSLFILSEAIPRLLKPQPFDALGMTGIAIVGVIANGIGALRLRGNKTLNTQVLTWHLLEDVLGWIAVLIVGIVSLFVDMPILDPILSVLITLYILWNTLIKLRRTVLLFLQASPSNIDAEGIERQFHKINEVVSTHHTHIWSLDGEHHVLTSHLVLAEGSNAEDALRVKQAIREIIEPLNLEHATIEIEFGRNDCSMDNTP